ncbi:hypothetical protein PF002_g24271 [Phytophthora fragariae]|uniref:BTB domain-containing protein n=1 Tax=Phytophthora fragariae TaxID=53985 RepID=A0A6A3DZR1_9STRA|nr:hypothetical protein PF009_g24083 [Phytophthora fragariae]KAE8981417.1 hypothetical protein PF011_g22029 [Phytophthora fragariae]KAE9079843.1 hypothetical protein PF007_g23287 [Phytophthora fragariae]KAE9102009.1 hypothetical protein PF006_g22543 [Phytophthora fragariae]KAE9192201.1 hypothetical protein PF002_g24271 [Phytophthora fragariae]
MSSVATAAWVDVPYAVDHRAASYFRGGFNSCAVRGDSLYVFGDLETLHEFNFEKKIWRVVPWNGDAPKPRQGYAGFHYGDCFYVFGGLTNGSIERDFIQYDFATRTWSVVVVNTGIQPAVICSFATVLHASSMYSLQQGQAQSVELHKFEFYAKTWTSLTTTGQPPQPRSKCAYISHVLQNETWVLVGSHQGTYNDGPIILSWSNFTITAKWGPPQAQKTCITLAHSKSVLVFGGTPNSENPAGFSSWIHELDVEAKSWFPVYCSNTPAFSRGFIGGIYNSNLIVFQPRTRESVDFCYKRLQLKNGDNLETTNSPIIKGSPSASYLRSLVDKPSFSDVTFIVEDTEVFGHKNLCMRYESFKALIQAEEQGSHSPRIEITDMSRATFLLLFVAADRFEIESLKQLCANKVRNSITVETAADIFKLADQHRAVELQNECAAMIMANFEVVSKSQAFHDLLLNNSSLVLKMLKLN